MLSVPPAPLSDFHEIAQVFCSFFLLFSFLLFPSLCFLLSWGAADLEGTDYADKGWPTYPLGVTVTVNAGLEGVVRV